MRKTEIMALLREKKWTVSALAERWGYSRRHVTARIADEGRGRLWEDALSGLSDGPGFYRVGLAKVSPPWQSELGVGSLVASESEMFTFGYGARGVVVEILGRERWRVVWDGGSEMEIDADCLRDWVMDLGMEVGQAQKLRDLEIGERVVLAQKMDLSC